MNIKIIKAKPEDAIHIKEINSKTWLNTYQNEKFGINEELLEKNPTTDESKKKFLERKKKELINNPGSYFIAKEGDNVIGYAAGRKHDNGLYNEFFAIYILPEYQKQGIGIKLVSKVFAYLGKEKPIFLEVIEYNTSAIKFYEKLGFKFHKKLDDYEIIDGIYVPEIQMLKNI